MAGRPIEVVLHVASSQGLGFSVIGGADSPNPDLQAAFVTRVEAGSPAAEAGIVVGDRLDAVNGSTCNGLVHGVVVDLLRACGTGGAVTLTLHRDETRTAILPVDVQVVASLPTEVLTQEKGPLPDGLAAKLEIGEFAVKLSELVELIAERSDQGMDRLRKKYHGVETLALGLRSNIETGLKLTPADRAKRTTQFGLNKIPELKPKNIFQLMWEALQDVTLIILMIAATISLILGLTVEEDKSTGWIDGCAILVSVCIVVLVTAVNDLQKERQFQALQATQDAQKMVWAFRDGVKTKISIYDILVGDVLEVDNGMVVPADGVLFEGFEIECDESALTGESEAIVKDIHSVPWMLSGTSVNSGGGKMLVTCVGLFSEEGIINRLITGAGEKEAARLEALDRQVAQDVINVASELETHEQEATDKLPLEQKEQKEKKKKKRSGKKESILQAKLTKMAVLIGKGGTVAAILTVVVLLARFGIEDFGVNKQSWDSSKHWSELLEFFIIGVTVLVVAVPEGLPLAVAISLAYSVKKMLKAQNLVRILGACETMGNATTICSDKTGTLTQNRMSVVRVYVNGMDYQKPEDAAQLAKSIIDPLAEGCAVNSSPNSHYKFTDKSPYPVQDGNKTECACLQFADSVSSAKYAAIREATTIVKQYKFDHHKKRMTTVVRRPDGKLRVLVKGASEIVLQSCRYEATVEGPRAFDQTYREQIEAKVITAYAEKALRVILIAYRDLDEADANLDDDDQLVQDLVISCLVGIQDPVRPEVPGAIAICQQAGVTVRMVTGDNKITARAIAINCGIIAPGDDFLVMEGPEFRREVVNADGTLNQARLSEIWPKLRVMARCSPSDKYNLVRGLIHDGEVVAVTGDGTNDGPALAEADVGFSMGSGTQVAQESSDIVILDDNFSSMVAAISWGRNVYDSISKFLTFQLTVNVVAVVTAFVGAAALKESPLKAVQLLWVNLIMDSFASLALATEPPTAELLLRQPYKRTQPLLSRIMIRQILGHTLYQLIVMFVLIYAGDKIFNVPSGRQRTKDWVESCKASLDPYADCGEESAHYTILFNTFVWMQIFNEINARKIHDQINVFKNFFNNPLFTVILLGTIGAQIILIEVGGKAFSTTGLEWNHWLGCIAFGAGVLPWNVVIHYLFPWRWIPESWSAATKTLINVEELMDASSLHSHHSAVIIPSTPRMATRLRPLNKLWSRGVHRLRTQLRIVSMFRDAGRLNLRRRVTGHRMSITNVTIVEVPRQLPHLSAAQALWRVTIHRIRQQLRVAQVFRDSAVRNMASLGSGQVLVVKDVPAIVQNQVAQAAPASTLPQMEGVEDNHVPQQADDVPTNT